MEKVRTLALVNRLRFSDYFKDYDHLKKGTIASNKFRGVLS